MSPMFIHRNFLFNYLIAGIDQNISSSYIAIRIALCSA